MSDDWRRLQAVANLLFLTGLLALTVAGGAAPVWLDWPWWQTGLLWGAILLAWGTLLGAVAVKMREE